MLIHGLSEKFWVVTKPSPVSELGDICFACTFERLMTQVRGGLNEDEIMGIYADEGEAKDAAMRLLGQNPVRPCEPAFFEVVVNVMVQPKTEEMTAAELGVAAVEAVRNAVRQGEEAGFRHHLAGQVVLGAGTVELRNQTVVTSQVVLSVIEPGE